MSKITLNGRPATAVDVVDCINALRKVQDKYRHRIDFRICLALRTLESRGEVSPDTRRRLTAYISRQLGGQVTLGSWHSRKLGYFLSVCDEHQARLAWIDHMIEQYQAMLPHQDN